VLTENYRYICLSLIVLGITYFPFTCSKYNQLFSSFGNSNDSYGFNDVDGADGGSSGGEESNGNEGGELNWAIQIISPGKDHARGVARLTDGSIIVIGSCEEQVTAGSTDGKIVSLYADEVGAMIIARYSQLGVVEWVKWEGRPLVEREGATTVRCISALPDGTFVVAGIFTQSVVFGKGEDNEAQLTADDSHFHPDMFLARYDTDGKLLWVRRDGGEYIEDPNDISPNIDGSVVVAGYYNGEPVFGLGESNETRLESDGYDTFVAKYDINGILVWVKSAGGPDWQHARGISSLPDGSMIVVGTYKDTTTFGMGETNETVIETEDTDIFIAKYNSNGMIERVNEVKGSYMDTCHDVSALSDGSFIVTGQFDGSITFDRGERGEVTMESFDGWDMFVARYNHDGTLDWVRRVAGDESVKGYEVSTFEDGSSVVVGSIYYGAVFCPGETCEKKVESANGTDVFVAKYDDRGNLLWVRTVAGWGGEDYSFDIQAQPDGSSIVAGSFIIGATFGPGEKNEVTFTTQGDKEWDVFLMRLGP